ncbi:hypothetical protein AAFC00_006304 [Neodothiora populina]|uniref:Methyltransferase domain-containing protein n=1 Tax=Neodothiora populina TaxID=2781224 RepID=A0ABR3P4Q3_9PEZI
MGPECSLPISHEFESPESYVDALLRYVASSDLLQTLCGGVHVLDFFTRKPDFYSLILPEHWRAFFKAHDIMHTLDFFMREDLAIFDQDDILQWRDGPLPPADLLQYVRDVRKFSLNRKVDYGDARLKSEPHKLANNVSLGMKVKKVHEVSRLASYVDQLTSDIKASQDRPITHLVDFGSGQNYLGRALASEPYNKHIIAVESRPHNIEGARNWDIKADLAPKKERVMRNKKEYREQMKMHAEAKLGDEPKATRHPNQDVKGERGFFARNKTPPEPSSQTTLQMSAQGIGSIQYIEHYIKDGDLSRVIDQIVDQDAVRGAVNGELVEASKEPTDPFVEGSLTIKDEVKAVDPSLMVISLHSCGNLVHHGIRSLLLNPAVSAVALVGCCYNLLTERLGPATYKLPALRSNHPRLVETSNACDPHGFPMSDRLCKYMSKEGRGVRLNITARMMAVQAPYNWGESDSDIFFTRHFYRALLQLIFLDCGIVEQPKNEHVETNDGSPLGWSGGTAPIIIGSLKKSCYSNFAAYVRGALEKLVRDPERGPVFQEKMGHLNDEEIYAYETNNAERKKELSVIWSLMAFSASVIEAVIVSDRWLFLKEQPEVAEAWVEPIFDYALSPRNFIVVGIKR